LAVTSHGKLVSGGGIDGALLLWSPSAPGEPAREIARHDGVVLAASVAQDGLVAYGGLDGVIRIWSRAGPGAPGRHLGRCNDGIRVLAVTLEHMIVSGSHDREIRIRDPTDHQATGRILGRHEGQVRGIGITADGGIVAVMTRHRPTPAPVIVPGAARRLRGRAGRARAASTGASNDLAGATA